MGRGLAFACSSRAAAGVLTVYTRLWNAYGWKEALPVGEWYSFPVAFVALDFLYYWWVLWGAARRCARAGRFSRFFFNELHSW